MSGSGRVLAAWVTDMPKRSTAPSACYTPGEIAQAAAADRRAVLGHLGPGAERWDALVPHAQAVALVRQLRQHAGTAPRGLGRAASGELFRGPAEDARKRGGPLVASTTMHVLVLAGVALISTVAADSGSRTAPSLPVEPVRMVYLAIPGPGGGGGGGGARQPAPPPEARRQGVARLSSPVPVRRARPADPPPRPPEPEVPQPEVQPPVAAPVAEVAGDDETRAGLPTESAAKEASLGSGSGGGLGSGTGLGSGEGEGPGLGPGSGGGTGGGPYRPGSGVEPPVVVREVRPTYTEEARRRGITGEVLLEVVVLRDGTVGQVRVVDGLGSGLDERAIEAVRQWRFDPARLRGAAVDVLVEIAVEFRLR